MITWKFENGGMAFKSAPEHLGRDIQRMAKLNYLSPETSVIIIDGTPNQPLPPNVSGSLSDTSDVPQSTIPVDTKKTKTAKSKTSELPTVPGDLDVLVIQSYDVESPTTDSDSGESRDWFDSQRV